MSYLAKDSGRANLAEVIHSQSCPKCNENLSFMSDEDLWSLRVLIDNNKDVMQERYGTWCRSKIFLQFDLNGILAEPGVVHYATSIIKSFGHKVKAFASMSNGTYLSWIECNICKRSIFVPREYTITDDAMEESAMGGYMHNRGHYRNGCRLINTNTEEVGK